MEPNSVLPYVPTKDDPLLDNITRYQKLLGAPVKGIRYVHYENKNNLSGYSDADYAKCLKTRKPVKGHCVFSNNCLVSWKGKKQNIISKSSTEAEAEYSSLSSAAYEIIWIQKLLLYLNTKVTLPIDLHCDNKSALQLAINLVFHERFKVREAKDVDSKVDKCVASNVHGPPESTICMESSDTGLSNRRSAQVAITIEDAPQVPSHASNPAPEQ
nr:ribonuclease H-like domain-containing protein [Tanacetum cinerariifolium]